MTFAVKLFVKSLQWCSNWVNTDASNCIQGLYIYVPALCKNLSNMALMPVIPACIQKGNMSQTVT